MNFRLATYYFDFVTKTKQALRMVPIHENWRCSRFQDFCSTASAAESLRSRCGSVRRVPVFSLQGSLIAAPQNSTRHRKHLFPGEFFGFHGHMM